MRFERKTLQRYANSFGQPYVEFVKEGKIYALQSPSIEELVGCTILSIVKPNFENDTGHPSEKGCWVGEGWWHK